MTDPRKYRLTGMHICAWLIFILVGTLCKMAMRHQASINVLDIFFTQLPSIYVFYGNNYIFSNFLSRKKITLLIIAELVFFSSYQLLSYIDGYIIAPLINPHEPNPPFSLSYSLATGLWVFFLYSFFAFGYYFARRAVKKEKELRETELKKLLAEQEKLDAEYAFLRAQINPHFLHNTLSFFYAKSLGCSEELSTAILTLSDIMRYSLEGGEDDNGTVPLDKEVEHLQKVIAINQLRFNHKLQVQFKITGNMDNIRIIPLIFITLVENAFKHGELTNPAYPLSISFEISPDGRQLHFSTFNKKKTGPKELSHGIGINNMRKRLERAYKDGYTLTIKDEGEFYSADLLIGLTEDPGAAVLSPLAHPRKSPNYFNFKILEND